MGKKKSREKEKEKLGPTLGCRGGTDEAPPASAPPSAAPPSPLVNKVRPPRVSPSSAGGAQRRQRVAAAREEVLPLGRWLLQYSRPMHAPPQAVPALASSSGMESRATATGDDAACSPRPSVAGGPPPRGPSSPPDRPSSLLPLPHPSPLPPLPHHHYQPHHQKTPEPLPEAPYAASRPKRPRASRSLLDSFRHGSTGNLAPDAAGDDPSEGVSGSPRPSSSSSVPLASLHGRDRSPSLSSGSSDRERDVLRRTRSNSNIFSASSRLEDLVWKRRGGEADPRLLTSEEDEEEMVFLPHERPSSRAAVRTSLGCEVFGRLVPDPLPFKSTVATQSVARRPSPAASLEAIAKDRHYAKGEKVPFDEDREHEFKQLHNVDKPVKRIADYCGKYINAFLNTNGGVCYFGIDDDGVVYGVHLSRSDRDAIRLHVDGIVEAFWPAVDTRTCAIVFVPVAPPSPKDTFVMELHVAKGTAPVYLMSKNKPTAYMRRSGSIYQMSMEMILQRMNFTMNSSGPVFQPLQSTLPKRPNGECQDWIKIPNPADILTYRVGNAPRNFVGRQTELEEILDQIESSDDHVKVVALYGQGGVGKTTLSRRIAASMTSAYPDGQFCIQLNGSTPNPCKTHDAMLYAIRAFHPSIAMPSSPTEVEGYYLSCFNQKRSVLLLDDAASKEQVLSLLPKSSCLVIVTSRRSLGLDVELGAVCVKKLGKLSLSEAVAMVQQMTRGKVTEEQAEQLAELCGYLPLAVQVVSATLAKQSNLRPEAMIQRLTENKAEILRLEGNTVELCIKASFELLSTRLQLLFLPLSVFPGSFDEEAAARVLDVDAQAAQETLSEFLTNSLLEHNPVTWRYYLHFTVRVFASVLAQKMEQEQIEKRNEANMEDNGDAICRSDLHEEVNIALWKERFVLHYHDLMKRFQSLYKRGGDYILMGLELFDQNKHNIEEAMRLSIREMVGFPEKRYSLFCSFAKAGKDIFRARLNQSKFFELYRDFLTEVKPELLVTCRRGRGRGRGRRDEQELQDAEQDTESNLNANDGAKSENMRDSNDFQPEPNISIDHQRRHSISTSPLGDNESELVEDDDLVFVLNELGQAFVAQSQYHMAEVYYRHALRISEKHFTQLHANGATLSTSLSPASSQDDVTSFSATVQESEPISIPSANAPVSSLSSACSSLPDSARSLPHSSLPLPSSLSFESEDKRWRLNLAATLHNLGKLYGEQCSFSTAVEYLQRALELRQTTCRHLSSKADGPDAGSRRTETEGKKKMRRGMEDREIVGESMLALGACFTQLGKYDDAELQFKEVLSLYRPATSSPLIKAITRLSPPSESSPLSTSPPSSFVSMATSASLGSALSSTGPLQSGLPNLDEELEVEEHERQRLREELKLSKLGSTDSHGLQVAACLDHLGALLTIRGKYQEASSLHCTSLGMKQKLLGSSHLEVARTRHYLAKVLGLAGRYKEAIEEYEVSLRIREDCLGPSHPLVANSLRHIAFLHFYTGEYTQAEKMYETALKMLKDVFDRPHLEIAIVLNDLGLIYNHQSRYAKSQPYLRHSLAIRKKLLGKNHPYIAVVFNNLGNMYRKQRKFEMAEKYLMKALTIRENCFGSEHPEVARSLHNIAALRVSQKRYSEAQTLFQQSLEIRSKVLGHFHPELASVHSAIGHLHECQKNFNDAIAHYNVALQINCKAFGEHHPSISTNYYKLGNCYRLMKRFAEAEPMLQASRDVCFRCFGEEQSLSDSSGRSVPSDRQRITPGHERILQSDDTLQKFYKEWAEYIMSQSREKRRLEERASSSQGDSTSSTSPTGSPTLDEVAESTEAEQKQRIREARRRRRELRKKMKREGTWIKGMDETLMEELMLAEEEDEKFNCCIEVLNRMGREEDLAEVIRIEQRLVKLREQRRQRLSKEQSERKMTRLNSTNDIQEGGSDDSDSSTSEDGKVVAEAANEAALDATPKEPRDQATPNRKEGNNDTKNASAKKLSKKERVRLWKEREAENKNKATSEKQPSPPVISLHPDTRGGAVVVITVRHLVVLLLALLTTPVLAFIFFYYAFLSSA